MTMTTVQSRWFLLTDKWHREIAIHYLEPDNNKSSCGSVELKEINFESMVFFKTIDNIPVKDICKKCLRKKL